MEIKIDMSDAESVLDGRAYNLVESGVIRDVTLEAEGLCKYECPVDTGFLMNSHSTQILRNSGAVINTADYVLYVIYGHHSYRGNDYPQRALNRLEPKIQGIFDRNIGRSGLV